MGDAMKKVVILGSTGSIGLNTLRVIREHPDHFEVAGLAAGSNLELLKSQIDEFRPEAVYLKEPFLSAQLKAATTGIKIFTEDLASKAHSNGHVNGFTGGVLRAFTAGLSFDILMAATNGTSSLLSVLDALNAGKQVALANKEILVMAGGLVMQAARQNQAVGARHASPLLIPVDSEHNAIF